MLLILKYIKKNKITVFTATSFYSTSSNDENAIYESFDSFLNSNTELVIKTNTIPLFISINNKYNITTMAPLFIKALNHAILQYGMENNIIFKLYIIANSTIENDLVASRRNVYINNKDEMDVYLKAMELIAVDTKPSLAFYDINKNLIDNSSSLKVLKNVFMNLKQLYERTKRPVYIVEEGTTTSNNPMRKVFDTVLNDISKVIQ